MSSSFTLSCPVPRCSYKTNNLNHLYDHARKQHKNHQWNQQQATSVGGTACPCGVLCKSTLGIKRHQSIGQCKQQSTSPTTPSSPSSSQSRTSPPSSPITRHDHESKVPDTPTADSDEETKMADRSDSSPKSNTAIPRNTIKIPRFQGKTTKQTIKLPQSGKSSQQSMQHHHQSGKSSSTDKNNSTNDLDTSWEDLFDEWNQPPRCSTAAKVNTSDTESNTSTLSSSSSSSDSSEYQPSDNEQQDIEEEEEEKVDIPSSPPTITSTINQSQQYSPVITSGSSSSAASSSTDTITDTSQIILTPANYHHLSSMWTPKTIPDTYKDDFTATIERLSRAYIDDPSELTLFHILCLPKMCLRDIKHTSRVKERLQSYPQISWNVNISAGNNNNYNNSNKNKQSKQLNPVDKAKRFISHGNLSRACQQLWNHSPIASPTSDTISKLQQLHPSQLNPINWGNRKGQDPGDIQQHYITNAIHSLNIHTGAGISGWTTPMIQHAFRNSQSFIKFIVLLSKQIYRGTAPGASMLCSSKLIPLVKDPIVNKIRPIAVGEIMYRICMKAILHKTLKDYKDILLPTQLGVGTPTGVEPILLMVEQSLNINNNNNNNNQELPDLNTSDKHFPDQHTENTVTNSDFPESDNHITESENNTHKPINQSGNSNSNQGINNNNNATYFYRDHTHDDGFNGVGCIDLANAFNNLSRNTILSAIRSHCPKLERTFKWAYGTPHPLIISGNYHHQQQPVIIPSAEGVRQGDPLGPLLFSLGFRSVIETLEYEVEGIKTMSYLDDLTILCPSTDHYDRIITTLKSLSHHGIIVNENKSKYITKQQIRNNDDGYLEILGSCIGTTNGRRHFLNKHIHQIKSHLHMLRQLTSQEAYLLLSKCVAQQMRHLLRSMNQSGLQSTWKQLDTLLINFVKELRGPVATQTSSSSSSSSSSSASSSTASTAPTTLSSTASTASTTLSSPTSSTSYNQWEDTIITLPLRYGGLGITSHADTADMIRDTAIVQADAVLNWSSEIENENDNNITSVKDKINQYHLQQYHNLINHLPDSHLVQFIDMNSKVSRSWLTTIPSSKYLRLSDPEVACYFRSKTLSYKDNICIKCGSANSVSHIESCPRVSNFKVARHELIKKSLGRALTLSGNDVQIEPFVAATGNTNNNNNNNNKQRLDIKVSGPAAPRGNSALIDVSVVTLQTTKTPYKPIPTINTASSTNNNESGNSHNTSKHKINSVDSYIQGALDTRSKDKTNKYQDQTQLPVLPFCISSNGTMNTKAVDILRTIQDKKSFIQELSIILARSKCHLGNQHTNLGNQHSNLGTASTQSVKNLGISKRKQGNQGQKQAKSGNISQN